MSRNQTPELAPSRVEELYGRAGRRVRRLAVFGPRGSGKTCFFASLYGPSTDPYATLTFDHDPTTEYLEKMWNAYAEEPKGFPDPTAAEVPRQLLFHVADNNVGRQWEAEILDHAGELVQRIPGGNGDKHLTEELREIVRVWLRECEAILIFLDTTQADSEDSLERRNEVSILLKLCREASESGQVTRPLGLVLTKWDSLGTRWITPVQVLGDEQPNGEEDLQAKLALEEKVAREYLSRKPSLRQIHQTVEAFGQAVSVFPVSAIGFNRQTNRKPTDPYNLLTPLLWALRQTDESRGRAAEAKAEQKPLLLSRAVKCYQELIDQDGVTCGPVFERIAPRLEELKTRQKARGFAKRVIGFAVAAVLLLGILGGTYSGWAAYADRQYKAWLAFSDNEGRGEENAGQRIIMADTLMAWHGPVLDHEAKSMIDTRRLRDREIERAYTEVTDWKAIQGDLARLENMEEPEQIKLRERLRETIKAFGEKHAVLKAGKSWRAVLAEIKETLVVQHEERKRYEAVVAKENASSPTGEGEIEELIRLWESYLASLPAPRPYYVVQAGVRIVGWKDRHDQQVLKGLGTEAEINRREHLHECSGFIQKLELFAINRKNKANTETDAAIKKMIDRELMEADRLVYGEALVAVNKAKTNSTSGEVVGDLKEAQTKIKSYLDKLSPSELGHPRPLAMKSAAENWERAWLDGVLKDSGVVSKIRDGRRDLIPGLPSFQKGTVK